MYRVSAQGVDERMINVHYYYYYYDICWTLSPTSPSVADNVSVSSQDQAQDQDHTPTIAFRHLPPNSARFNYATEGAIFISAQLSTDAVSALQKVIRLWKEPSAQAPT